MGFTGEGQMKIASRELWSGEMISTCNRSQYGLQHIYIYVLLLKYAR